MAKRFIGGEIVSNVAPAGSVAAFAGANAPSGWRICDGQTLSIELFPELYAAIGDTWNTATNTTSGSAYAAPAAGSFRLPDFRGSFLRGAGSPHTGDVCSVGGHQGQATIAHGHNVRLGVFTAQGSATHTGHDGLYQTAVGKWGSRPTFLLGSGGFNVSNNGSETETRPLNQGVNYIIKY